MAQWLRPHTFTGSISGQGTKISHAKNKINIPLGLEQICEKLSYLSKLKFHQAGSNRWWTGRPGVLQSMGLQRVGHN